MRVTRKQVNNSCRKGTLMQATELVIPIRISGGNIFDGPRILMGDSVFSYMISCSQNYIWLGLIYVASLDYHVPNASEVHSNKT